MSSTARALAEMKTYARSLAARGHDEEYIRDELQGIMDLAVQYSTEWAAAEDAAMAREIAQ